MENVIVLIVSTNLFIYKTKVNVEIKCPNCKQKLLVKTDRLMEYEFKDHLQLLDKIENIYILRTFELYSRYNSNSIKHITTEFMRTIIKDGTHDFVTNQVHNNMGYMYISHWQKFENWRPRSSRWAYRDVIGMICPYNLKSLLKDTNFKYCQLDKFVSKIGYVDFLYYFPEVENCPAFEMLVKMKLYNLASHYRYFHRRTFQENIGLPKTYYEFMKKHNIDYHQLQVLRIIKKMDIKLINSLKQYNYDALKTLSRYVNLEKAHNLVLKSNSYRIHDYVDYLDACLRLGYDMKDRHILYPDDLKKSHDKVMDLLEIVENEANDRLIKERVTELKKYVYKDKKYIVFPADSVESLVEESRQLSHCVKTYADKFALGRCDLYFMRKIDNQNKSLITIEVQDGEIIQSRTKNNGSPNDEQLKFIEKWQRQKLLNV